MTDETSIEWKPLSTLPDCLWIEAFHHDPEGCRIVLRWSNSGHFPEAKSRIRIVFGPLAYRWFDQRWGFAWHPDTTPESVPQDLLYVDDPPSPCTALSIIENSVWLRSFHQASREMYGSHGFKHYVVNAENGRLEALSGHEPKVEWIDA